MINNNWHPISYRFWSYRSLLFKFWTLCVFEPPFGGGGLRTTYDVHLGLIGKRLVDFLLVLIELFSLSVTAEALRANIGSESAILLQRGPVDPKFQVEEFATTNHSSSQKTRLNDLSYGINLDRFFFHFVTIHAFVGRTDRILIVRPRLHSMQRGKNDKKLSYHRDSADRRSLRRLTLLKVANFGTNRKPVCDFHWWIILTCIIYRTVYQISCSIARGCLSLTNWFSEISASIAIRHIPVLIKTTFLQTFLSQTVWIYLQPVYVIRPKAAEFGSIMQNEGQYVVRGHSKPSVWY